MKTMIHLAIDIVISTDDTPLKFFPTFSTCKPNQLQDILCWQLNLPIGFICFMFILKSER